VLYEQRYSDVTVESSKRSYRMLASERWPNGKIGLSGGSHATRKTLLQYMTDTGQPLGID
jgi:hypothetical protein